MYIKKVMPKLGALIAIALLASGGAGTALAADQNAVLSGADVLDQAVALYEKLLDTEVEIPEPLMQQGLSEPLLKSVVLGYANLDDVEEIAQFSEVRKQDVMTILYKTVINYDSSYAISEDEANEILNDCYDNAYIDEENRIAYAFMIRQGIISSNSDTEPNKPLTWESCRILVDLVYDYFIKDVTVQINDTAVTIGSNIESVLEVWGNPNRIDKSDYGFNWYVYNTDYENFAMIGVEGDRICAFYTNSMNFSYNGIASGSDLSEADEIYNSNLTLIPDSDGKLDSILYNPRKEGQDPAEEIEKTRSLELLDIINSYRVKYGKSIFVADDDTSDTAWLAALDYMKGAAHEDTINIKGYDIYSIYQQLLTSRHSILTDNFKKDASAGICVCMGSDDNMYACVIIDDTKREKREIEQVDPSEVPEYTAKIPDETDNKLFGIIPVAKAQTNTETQPTAAPVENVTAPVLEDFEPNEFGDGDDIVLNLEERAADNYHLEVYDIESDDYLINSYISTSEQQLSIPSDILRNGLDYTVTVSSVSPDGEEFASDEKLISYGSAYDTGIIINNPSQDDEYVTDNDYIALEWESDLYHDFYVDVYNSSGDMIINTIISDDYSALIQGLDPGDYYVYVTALRRGTLIEKAQDMIHVKIEMPEPVITEITLDKDDKYYFVYEDEALGVLYFYDEKIIEVEENSETVKKKQVIQKQVKATKAYRNLAKYQERVEYTTGDPVIHSSATAIGNAIVEEAKKYLGVPYVWGGTTPSGFDCSGLVQYVCASLGITVDRVTYDQINNGIPVTQSELQPGDLVFFEKNGDIHHVGIYVGNGEFIHAPSTGDVVKISSLETGYYASTYYGARRVY